MERKLETLGLKAFSLAARAYPVVIWGVLGVAGISSFLSGSRQAVTGKDETVIASSFSADFNSPTLTSVMPALVSYEPAQQPTHPGEDP